MKTRIVQDGHFTEVTVNGQTLKEVTNIRTSHPVDGIATVEVDMNLWEQFEFIGDANLVVYARVMPGFQLELTERPDGTKVFRCVNAE